MVGSDFLELCASNKVVLNEDGCLNRITVKAVIAGEGPLWPDLVVVKLLHGCPGFLFVGEGDKGVTSIVPIEVHHHPHLVDLTKLMTGAENAGTLKKAKKWHQGTYPSNYSIMPHLLTQRNQFILKQISREFPHKYLTTSLRRWSVPVRRRATVPPLTVLLKNKTSKWRAAA